MDKWTSEGKVTLDTDVMHLPAMGRSFRLEQAVYLTKMVEGADAQGLLGRVKSVKQLEKLGAEHYGNSVIMGEVAYECEEGFLGVPTGDTGTGTALPKLGG
jgi:hypothetical protein